MAEPDHTVEFAEDILAWLGREPDDDLFADLAALRANFARLMESGEMEPDQFERLLTPFGTRALDLCGRFVPWLMNASLPLTDELHTAATGLVEALLDIAAGFQSLIGDMRNRWMRAQRVELAGMSSAAMLLVGKAYLIGCMAGAAVPAGLWRRAHEVMRLGEQFIPEANPGTTPIQLVSHYKYLLSMSVAQPETLTARELVWLSDYLEVLAGSAELAAAYLQPATSAYWVDVAQDSPPVASVRRAPQEGESVLYFNPVPMASRVEEQIEWLENRILEAEVVGLERDGELLAPEVSGLPEGLTPMEALSLLRRLRERWAAPMTRAQPRRHHEYTVQVCAGLRAIWDMAKRGEEKVRIVEWTVRNESSNGYSIMSVSGIEAGLTTGMALAVRRDTSQPWLVCIVRWIRSEQPGQAELGLQVVAESFTPVQICFRGGEARAVCPALILAPIKAVRSNQAILSAAGTYVSRRFALMHEGPRLYVAQARVLSLDMQTAAIELFQYEIDPYPI